MQKRKSNKLWLNRQNRDPYVNKARASNYRSRAVYKLQEIDKKYKLIKSGFNVVDLGAAPGSWSQYVCDKVGGHGQVIAVDKIAMEAINGVKFIQGDFSEKSVEDICLKYIDYKNIDLVISDIAPNLTGIMATDQSRSMALAELVFSFCKKVLKPRGNLLIKIFEGTGSQEYRKMLEGCFDKVIVSKPSASKLKSREYYILAQSYRL